MRVIAKVATYCEDIWHAAGDEFEIAEKHFSDEVHILIEDLEGKKDVEPVEPVVTDEVQP